MSGAVRADEVAVHPTPAALNWDWRRGMTHNQIGRRPGAGCIMSPPVWSPPVWSPPVVSGRVCVGLAGPPVWSPSPPVVPGKARVAVGSGVGVPGFGGLPLPTSCAAANEAKAIVSNRVRMIAIANLNRFPLEHEIPLFVINETEYIENGNARRA